MLKIAMLGSRGIPVTYSGIETALLEICPRLVKRGHQVVVYTKADLEFRKESFKGVLIRRLPSLNTKHFETLTRLFGALLKEMVSDSDIVHFHALGPSVFSFLPRAVGKKSVATIHGLDWQRAKWGWFATQMLKFGEYASAKFPNKTISVSQSISNYYREKYNKQTAYIPNGVNIPVFQQVRLIKEYGIEPKKYLLFLSRLVPEKGAHYLIEAYKGLDTSFKLVIAGGHGHTESYAKQLYNLSENNPNIIFTGYVSGDLLNELFGNAYAYVLPSEIEGLPIALLEAMSFGLCVLVSNIQENMNVIKNRYGFSFKNKDVCDLRNKLKELISMPSQVKNIGEISRRHVYRYYNWDRITDQLEELYLSL
jgi:glycosyltransferase involved in cell wall biosynthesis